MRGIHHITAITAHPAKNIHFYEKILGLRLIKLTVNHDDPTAYHLYYGDGVGTPGTILTFFDFGDMAPGVVGDGQVSRVLFAIPTGSSGFWQKRLKEQKVAVDKDLHFHDPDGMPLGLVELDREEQQAWTKGTVKEHAISGFAGINMRIEESELSAELLKKMGFEGKDTIFTTPDKSVIRLEVSPESTPGRQGAGSVHHIAWRAKDDAEQEEWRAKLIKDRFNVTPIIDRIYFHSIYFREPGGVLFEIATDGPGFTKDEPLESLGGKLVLPSWFEPQRKQIEKLLPDLNR